MLTMDLGNSSTFSSSSVSFTFPFSLSFLSPSTFSAHSHDIALPSSRRRPDGPRLITLALDLTSHIRLVSSQTHCTSPCSASNCTHTTCTPTPTSFAQPCLAFASLSLGSTCGSRRRCSSSNTSSHTLRNTSITVERMSERMQG